MTGDSGAGLGLVRSNSASRGIGVPFGYLSSGGDKVQKYFDLKGGTAVRRAESRQRLEYLGHAVIFSRRRDSAHGPIAFG
jgi:hypothetical protein